MTMFSEMLREMDRNTIRYMVDDLKEKVEIRLRVLKPFWKVKRRTNLHQYHIPNA